VLATPAGAAAVQTVAYRWDLHGVDHVPIQITLNTSVYEQEMTVPVFPSPINTTNAMRATPEQVEQWAREVCDIYADDLQRAVREQKLDLAHEIWCDMATAYLIKATGQPPPTNHDEAPRRGRKPHFIQKRIAAKTTGHLYGAGATESEQCNTMAQRAKALEQQLRTMDYGQALAWTDPDLLTDDTDNEDDGETPGLIPENPNDKRIRDCPCGKWRPWNEPQCECGSKCFFAREPHEPPPENATRSATLPTNTTAPTTCTRKRRRVKGPDDAQATPDDTTQVVYTPLIVMHAQGNEQGDLDHRQ
jgi:hypothetical protein